VEARRRYESGSEQRRKVRQKTVVVRGGVVDGKGEGYISKTTWRILNESELIGPVMYIYIYTRPCIGMMGRRNIRRAARV